MSLSRKIALANASLLSGKWDRKSFEGTQLGGKTLGVVGLGRIGRALAKRANGLEMHVLGFDPFLPAGATIPGVEILTDLNELCRRSDYISVHTPKSPETASLIGAAQFAVMKPSVRLINAARGGIIDEAELLKALNEGRAAGAGIDVYMKEPPESEVEKALIAHPKVLAIPHLGASTAEAQEQVALEAAEIVVEFLRGGKVRNAVNKPVRSS
jgi:D-3-phosphoglycerate dehydrogenase